MNEKLKDDMEDLLPSLTNGGIWEGSDPEFAAYVRQAFGTPPSLTRITITDRMARGRSAVGIASDEGAIVFVITPNASTRQTHVAPYVMGPIVKNEAIVNRAMHSDGAADSKALSGLIIRRVSPEKALDLMVPPRPH